MKKQDLYEMVYLYSQNVPISSLAKKFNKSEESIESSIRFFLYQNCKKLVIYTYDFVKRYENGQSYEEIAKVYKTTPANVKKRIEEYNKDNFYSTVNALLQTEEGKISLLRCYLLLSITKNNINILANSLNVKVDWLKKELLDFCNKFDLEVIDERTNKKIILENYKKLVNKNLYIPSEDKELDKVIYLLVKNKKCGFKEIADAFKLEKNIVEIFYFKYLKETGIDVSIAKLSLLASLNKKEYRRIAKSCDVDLKWLENEILDFCEENDLQMIDEKTNKKIILENYKKLVNKNLYVPSEDKELDKVIYLLVQNKRCNFKEIADTFELEKDTIKNLYYDYQKKNGIKVSKMNKEKEIVEYHKKGLTNTEIAKMYGCSRQNVGEKLKNYYHNKSGETYVNNTKKRNIRLENIVNKKYENKTIEELAKEQGLPPLTLLNKINYLCTTNNLSRTEYIKTEYEKKNYEKQKKIISLYEFGYTQTEIAEKLGTTQGNIRKRLDTFCRKNNLEKPVFLSVQEINKLIRQKKDIKEIEEKAEEKKKKIPTKKVIDALKQYRQDIYLYYLDKQNINRYNLEPTIKKEYQKIKEVNNYDRY